MRECADGCGQLSPCQACVQLTGAAGRGLLGIGGGIVLAPLLLYLPVAAGAAALPVKIVTGLTIVQAISGSALGLLRHRSYGNVSRQLVLLMGPSSALGALAGALVSAGASDRLLLAIFAAVSFIGAFMLLLPPAGPSLEGDDLHVNAPLAVGLAAFLGFLSGMVGIGGIAFIIAVLVYVLRISPRVAIGSSLGIGLLGAVAALAGKAATAQIDGELAVLALVVALSGVRIAWSAVTGE